MAETQRVAVVGGNRTPFARSNTVYSHASNQDMLTAALDGLAARYGLEGERPGLAAAGAVPPAVPVSGLTHSIGVPLREAPVRPVPAS